MVFVHIKNGMQEPIEPSVHEVPTIMENQIEKKIEYEMETGFL